MYDNHGLLTSLVRGVTNLSSVYTLRGTVNLEMVLSGFPLFDKRVKLFHTEYKFGGSQGLVSIGKMTPWDPGSEIRDITGHG